MSETIKSSADTQDKFAQLAELLRQASLVAHQISQDAPRIRLEIPQLKRPENISKDQEWFWSASWQAGEREVNKALERGEYEDFPTMEAAISALHHHV